MKKQKVWELVDEHVYSDKSISSFLLRLRASKNIIMEVQEHAEVGN